MCSVEERIGWNIQNNILCNKATKGQSPILLKYVLLLKWTKTQGIKSQLSSVLHISPSHMGESIVWVEQISPLRMSVYCSKSVRIISVGLVVNCDRYSLPRGVTELLFPSRFVKWGWAFEWFWDFVENRLCCLRCMHDLLRCDIYLDCESIGL